MILKTYGAGTLTLEREGTKVFWKRDGIRSQIYVSQEEAVKALKSRGGIRWGRPQRRTNG